MHELFKYMMQYIQARMTLEWQDFDISYPEWLTRIVLDELCYITTLVVMSLAGFAVGMIMGFIVVLV